MILIASMFVVGHFRVRCEREDLQSLLLMMIGLSLQTSILQPKESPKYMCNTWAQPTPKSKNHTSPPPWSTKAEQNNILQKAQRGNQ